MPLPQLARDGIRPGAASRAGTLHEQPAQERPVCRDEEGSAKARRVGLYKDAKPRPPWQWRKTSNQ